MIYVFLIYMIRDLNIYIEALVWISNLLNHTILWNTQGLVVLTVQAHEHSTEPWSRVVLFVGLYSVALGVGGIKGSLPPHGAEQFDEETPSGRRQRSFFFNYFIFSLSCGALIAVTVLWFRCLHGRDLDLGPGFLGRISLLSPQGSQWKSNHDSIQGLNGCFLR